MKESKGSADPSRFYGVGVPALAKKLRRERLTYATSTELDLVDAHLKSNFGYFGSIDKTLSGFFILDDEGDDYTLLDLREKKGQIFFLDHDELRLRPIFDSLEAYAKWRAAKAKAEDDEEEPSLPRAPKPRSKRKPDTARLWRRYRWLVWLLAQPKQIGDDEAVATAVESLKRLCGDDLRKFGKAFEAERRQLANDPHAAIYWLLHFICLGQDAQRDRVVAAVETSKNALVRAFVAKFGTMGSDGALAVLPAFRKRRSRLISTLAPDLAKEPFDFLLKAFEVDPVDRGLDKAIAVWTHAKTEADRQRIRACVASKSMKGPGADYLRVELAARGERPIEADWLLEHDPQSVRFLELALLTSKSKALEARLADARKVDVILDAVLAATEKAQKKAKTLADVDRGVKPSLRAIASAPPATRALVARRIIARPDDFSDAARICAFEIVRTSKTRSDDQVPLLARAAMHMRTCDPVKAAATRARKGDTDAIAFLMAVIAYDERTCDEHHALYAKEAALDGLGVHLTASEPFAVWVERFGRPGYERLTSALFDQSLAPDHSKSILDRLSTKQASLLAHVLFAQPAKNSVYDKPRDVVEALLSPALHAAIETSLREHRDRKRAERYAAMLECFEEEDSHVKKSIDCRKAAAKVRSAMASWRS